MPESEVRTKEELPYGYRVLLPSIKEIHNRIGNGIFDRLTWNKIISLFLMCPLEVQEQIEFSRVLDADNHKNMIISLFVQIRFYLEKRGYLIEKKHFKKGSL